MVNKNVFVSPVTTNGPPNVSTDVLSENDWKEEKKSENHTNKSRNQCNDKFPDLLVRYSHPATVAHMANKNAAATFKIANLTLT